MMWLTTNFFLKLFIELIIIASWFFLYLSGCSLSDSIVNSRRPEALLAVVSLDSEQFLPYSWCSTDVVDWITESLNGVIFKDLSLNSFSTLTFLEISATQLIPIDPSIFLLPMSKLQRFADTAIGYFPITLGKIFQMQFKILTPASKSIFVSTSAFLPHHLDFYSVF